MNLRWDDLRLFLSVARLGGLSAATGVTGLSAATLSRRITALEREIGESLFVRSLSGYRLTAMGDDLLKRAEEVEAAMQALARWREREIGEPVVRVAADAWMSDFLSRHIGELWNVDDRFRIDLVTAHETAAIGRRAAEIGIHSGRPREANLAARQVGRVAYALYCLPKLVGGVAAALFVGITGEGGNSPSARWLMAHHGDRIAVRGNDPASVRELVAAGAGLSVFPCFVGDSDTRLARVAPPIPELVAEQWLVVHQDERHTPAVRIVRDRLAMLMKRSAPLFRGDLGNHV